MRLSLGEWASATGGRILAGGPDTLVGGDHPGGLAVDTRKLEPGQWFASLKGASGRDGHEYLEQALSSGAGGLIVSDLAAYETRVLPNRPDLPALLVPDTTKALADGARAILDKFSPFVVAVTGTVGKTSVKENIAHIASTRWPTLKNPHNWNTEIGLPLSVFELTEEHRVVVLECASRGLGQIHDLSLIARPQVAVITAIGPGHLSEFGSVERVARGKWEIVDGLMPHGVVVAPGDSQYTKEFGSEYPVVTFGLGGNNSVHPISVSPGESSTHCTIDTPQGAISTVVPGISRADLLNALCATAASLQIGIDTDDGTESLSLGEISEALRTLPSIPGRSEIMSRESGVEVIFDAYNSNPLSLDNALDALAARTHLSNGSPINRRVAVLGDMLELGDEAERYHREAGQHLAELPIDCLITVGELARLIRHAAEKRRGRAIEGNHFPNAEACTEMLGNWVKAGDLVLIKASRGMALEQLLEGKW